MTLMVVIILFLVVSNVGTLAAGVLVAHTQKSRKP